MKTAERLSTLERSAAQHEKQIRAIRDLVQEGMRLLVETRKEGRETRKDLRTLTANVNQLVNSLRPTNGHSKRKLDLN